MTGRATVRIDPDGSVDARASPTTVTTVRTPRRSTGPRMHPARCRAPPRSGTRPRRSGSGRSAAGRLPGHPLRLGWQPRRPRHRGIAEAGGYGPPRDRVARPELRAGSGARWVPLRSGIARSCLRTGLEERALGPGARTTPRGGLRLSRGDPADLDGLLVRDQPALAEAGLPRPGVRGHRLSRCDRRNSVIFPMDSRNPARIPPCPRLAAPGGAVARARASALLVALYMPGRPGRRAVRGRGQAPCAALRRQPASTGWRQRPSPRQRGAELAIRTERDPRRQPATSHRRRSAAPGGQPHPRPRAPAAVAGASASSGRSAGFSEDRQRPDAAPRRGP